MTYLSYLLYYVNAFCHKGAKIVSSRSIAPRGRRISLTASGALGATNLISNGTFEGSKGTGSLSGWGGSQRRSEPGTGNGGGYAAQLKASSGAASTYAYTTSKPVTNATAGVAYQLGGQVQSALAGQTVCLMLKELKAGYPDSVGSAQSCSVATSTWQSFATVITP